jgi:DNA-binding winged helix-turn-helix (wHTH) protein/Tol biopolymer transport system component
VEPQAKAIRTWRFGVFEVDARQLEVRRSGTPVKMREQSFRILVLLLEHAGELVSREELRRVLWPSDTFVDFDQSLNAAVMKLREALSDSTESPLYIQTVPKRGYRFIAPVSPSVILPLELKDRPGEGSAESTSHSAEIAGETARSNLTPTEEQVRTGWMGRKAAAAGMAALGVLAAVAILAAWWRSPAELPSVESVTQLTDDGEPKDGKLLTDGSRIYFNEGRTGSWKIAQVAVTGGFTAPVSTKLGDPQIVGLTKDGSSLLALAGGYGDSAYPLWSIPVPAGGARPLGGAAGQDANFFPDGRVLIAKGRDLCVAERDGSNLRKLVSMPGITILENPSVSPDGQRIVFTLYSRGWATSALFESAADGTGLRKRLDASEGSPCCGIWSPDGKYLLYQTTNRGSSDLWTLPMQPSFFDRSRGVPVRLTAGPLSYSGGVPSHDGKQIFAIGTKRRSELVRYDLSSHQQLPFLSGLSAINPVFSQDGRWVAYVSYPDHTLWRSRSDGTDRTQLTYPPMEVASPAMSPDGTKVAFRTSNWDLFVLKLDSGPMQMVAQHSDFPSWSPDGNLLLFTSYTDAPIGENSRSYMQVLDTRSGKTSVVPSSRGKLGGIWTSQSTLVAAPYNPTKFFTFDFQTRAWTDIAVGNFVNWVVSTDRRSLYFSTGGTEPRALRFRFADFKTEPITDLESLRQVIDPFSGTQIEVAPDGSLIFARDIGSQEIYALNMRWPR